MNSANSCGSMDINWFLDNASPRQKLQAYLKFDWCNIQILTCVFCSLLTCLFMRWPVAICENYADSFAVRWPAHFGYLKVPFCTIF